VSEIGRFGVFLPSYIWEGDGDERARGIREFARRVEALGFDSLFITDHLLAAKRFYSVSFLEPLSALAVAAGVTERVRLGTSILIMPLRNPVLLAKELATLQFLSENRMILGAGVGWNDAEYEAVGVHKSERGKRTDEMLDILVPLLEGRTVTYHGRYYSVDDLFIEPTASRRPEIWIGGGSQLADPKSPDVPRFVESVKARVLRSDGWIPRPTCPPEDIARDWSELQAYYRERGRDPQECVVAHENFLHLVLTNDPERAREEQHRAFLKVMSSERGPRYLESVYLFGTPDEVVASLQARVDAGVEYFVLHTMTPDPEQLRDWVDEIIPNVTFPATAGTVRRLAPALT
jgi:probable F420-dependent oxidoreductase